MPLGKRKLTKVCFIWVEMGLSRQQNGNKELNYFPYIDIVSTDHLNFNIVFVGSTLHLVCDACVDPHYWKTLTVEQQKPCSSVCHRL